MRCDWERNQNENVDRKQETRFKRDEFGSLIRGCLSWLSVMACLGIWGDPYPILERLTTIKNKIGKRLDNIKISW